jgi:RNA polymerase sigma factor (sigma-70 family)
MSEVVRLFREKYPAYNDVSDDELTLAIGNKYPAYLSQDEEFEDDFSSLTWDRNEDSEFFNTFRNAWLRGANQATTADVLVGESFGTFSDEDRFEEMALANRRSQALRGSKAYIEFSEAPEKDKISRFIKDPFEIGGQIIIESLSAQVNYGASRTAVGVAAGAAAGSVVPGVGTIAGAGVGFVSGQAVTTLGVSYGAKFNEMLVEEGIDVTNADAIRSSFTDPDTVSNLRNKSLKYGVPIALVDLMTMKLGGLVSGPVKKLGIEGAGGSVGEAAGQLASEGEITSPSEVFIEGVAGVGPGALQQSGISGINMLKDKQVQKDLKATQDKVDNVKNNREQEVLKKYLESIDEQQTVDPELGPATETDRVHVTNIDANAGEILQEGSVPNQVVNELDSSKYSNFDEVIFTDNDDPHIAHVTGVGRLTVNLKNLKKHIKDNGLDANEYIKKLIQEESIHDAHLKTLLGEWDASNSELSFGEYAKERFEKIASEMTEAQKKHVTDVYGEDISDGTMGAEYVRMLVQERRHGSVTESLLWNELGLTPAPATRNYFRRAFDYIRRKVKNDEIDPKTIESEVENLVGLLQDIEDRSNDMGDVEMARAEQVETAESMEQQTAIEEQRAEDNQASEIVQKRRQLARDQQAERERTRTDPDMERQAAIEQQRSEAPPTDPEMLQQEQRELAKSLEEILNEPIEQTASEKVVPSGDIIEDQKTEVKDTTEAEVETEVETETDSLELTEDENKFVDQVSKNYAGRRFFDKTKKADAAVSASTDTKLALRDMLKKGTLDRNKFERMARTIAANKINDLGRDQQNINKKETTVTPDEETGQTVIDQEADLAPSPEETLRKKERVQRVAKAIDKLPKAQREVMQLTMDGLTPAEIVETTGKKRQAVDTALSRARNTLNKQPDLKLEASKKGRKKKADPVETKSELRNVLNEIKELLGTEQAKTHNLSVEDAVRAVLAKRDPESEVFESDLKTFEKELRKKVNKKELTQEQADEQIAEFKNRSENLDTELGVKPKSMIDVDRIFSPLETEPESFGSKLRSVIEGFSTNFLSRFKPLKHLESKVFKVMGKKAPRFDLARKFEQLAGSPARAEKLMMDFHNAVVKPIKGLEKQFNRLMFLRRTKQRLEDDSTRKRVADYTLDDANRLLKELEADITPEQMKQLESAVEQYQEFMSAMLRMQMDSGRISQETLNNIVNSNDFYAPFVVLQHLQDSETASATGDRIDTTKQLAEMITGIDNTDFRLGDFIDAAYDKILTSYMLADKNLKMQELYALSQIDETGLVRELKETKVGKKKKVREKADHEVTVFVDGEQKFLAVNREVARSIEGLNAQTTGNVSKLLAAGSFLMKAGATTFNIAFQPINLLFADMPRLAMVSKYGFRSPADLVRLPLDYVHALYSSVTGNFGKPNALYKDFLNSGAARSTFQRALTPEVYEVKPTDRTLKLSGMGLLRGIVQLASSVEETSKLVGLKRGMRIENLAKMTPEQQRERMGEIVAEVRNFAGSPDFGRQGAVTRSASLNLLFMYFNARIQGVAADLGRLSGKDGVKDSALMHLRLATAVGVPTVALWALNNSDEYKEDYEKIHERDKENYWHIPTEQFFTNDDGILVRDYYRIPKREILKLYSNVVESSMTFLETRDPKVLRDMSVVFLENIMPVSISGEDAGERVESVISSLNPLIKGTLEFGMNRNTWLHRDVVSRKMKMVDPKEQYYQSTPEIFRNIAEVMPEALPESLRSPLMLKQLTGTMTAGLFTQFMPPRKTGRKPLGIFSDQNPLFRRFIRSPYVNESQTEEQLTVIERTEATRQLKESRAIQQFVTDTKGMSVMDRMIRARSASQGNSVLFRKYKKAIDDDANLVGRIDKRVRGLGVTSGARTSFIIQRLDEMPYQRKIEYLHDLFNKKIISPSVAQQIFQQTGIDPSTYAR